MNREPDANFTLVNNFTVVFFIYFFLFYNFGTHVMIWYHLQTV